MRYYNYLHEDKIYTEDDRETFESLKTILHSKCNIFLNESNGQKLYRGIRNPNHLYAIKKVRIDRKPVDNSKDVHRYFDKVLYEMFGWKARSQSLFCTGNILQTGDYGEPYVVVPIGRYNYLHSNVIQDLYLELLKPTGEVLNIINKYNIFEKIHQHNWFDIFERSNQKKLDIKEKDVVSLVKDICSLYKKNKGIDKAISSRGEIMLNCKEYLEIENDYFNQNMRELL